MAKLDEIAASLNLKIERPLESEKPRGHRRRPWLIEEDDSKGVYKPPLEKGSINGVNEPVLSTPLINPIDQPHYQKGLKKEVYKPLNISLDRLRGNPLKIAQYIFELLRQRMSQETDKITLMQIMNNLNLSKDSARTAMRFLLKNKLLERIDFQAGKLGWSKYKLKIGLYHNLEEAYQKGSINPLNSKGVISSSSLNINKTTTTEIPEEWEFDISAYAVFGFTKTQLKQLMPLGLSPLDVEDSLIHFAYDNANNYLPKILSTKINFLMGLLRRGQKYTSEKYFSENEKLLQEMAQREQDRKRKQEEDRFTIWFANLSPENEDAIVKKMPANLISAYHTYKKIGRMDQTLKDWMMGYFLECSM